MSSSPQSLPKQTSIDLSPAAAPLGGPTTDNLAAFLKATQPTRIRMVVTPGSAKSWLETTNVKNRPISELHWMKIWLDIVEGRWKYNGEPISFGTNGALLNGQHRLRACEKSGIGIDTDVIFGLNPGSWKLWTLAKSGPQLISRIWKGSRTRVQRVQLPI